MARDFAPRETTAEEIRARRDATGEGIHEARRFLDREALREALGYLRELGDLEDKVEFLLDRYEESHL